MKSLQLVAGIYSLMWTCSCAAQQPREAKMGPSRLVSVHVPRPPTLDGKLDEQVWTAGVPLQMIARLALPPNEGASVPVTIRCIHTDTDVYFAMTWEDPTHSVSHKTWVWNASKKAYEQAGDREDMFALAIEHTGPFDPDMLAGIEAAWDVWHWKAFRTNPHGYAMDKTHRYTFSKPAIKARSYEAHNGKTIWIARPQDAGDTVEKSRPAPTEYQGDRVAQYVPGTPNGSTADVRAKGVWADGRWTLEMGRRLKTDHIDDTAFDRNRSYKMALAAFDHTGDMDKASELMELRFAPLSTVHNFDADRAGTIPAGFSSELTGGGGPAKWAVLDQADAPSPEKVVAQLSDDRTNRRYPLLIDNTFEARDLDVSVRFKPISGKVDQAAGIVWRYQDADNYFIVRANALEDNVVAYKVEKGKRSSIGIKGDASSYGVKAEVPGGQWNSLRVVVVGKLFEIYLNDRKLFEVESKTFRESGKIGLWTKADSVTHFDDLVAISLDAASE